jgi:hypothetical protein
MSVLYLSTLGTYAALGLVVIGSFLMLISSMVRDRTHETKYLDRKIIVEDEEAALSS